MNALEVLDLIMSSDKEFKSKSAQLFEILKDESDDKWTVHIDDHAKSFVVYRGKDDICGGYYDPSTMTIKGMEFMSPKHQKNNKTRLKALTMIKKAFPNYK